MELLGAFTNNLPGILMIAFILFFFYKEYKSSNSDQRRRNDEENARALTTLTEEKDKCKKEKDELDRTVAARDATIIEKDKAIKKLEDQVAYKNPEVMTILVEMKELIKQNTQIMGKLVDFMHEFNKKQDHQTTILEGRETRDALVDRASAEGEGKIMRAPVD